MEKINMLVALDQIETDIYRKLVLMKAGGINRTVITEMDLAIQLGLVRSVMKQLGDKRDLEIYPGNHGGPDADKSSNSHVQ